MKLFKAYFSARSALLVTLALVAVATFSALAPGQSLDTVTPGDGTLGTAVTLTGSGFGTKPPKVWLSQDGTNKTWKLKVLSTTDTEVVAEVRKVAAGLFDVNLRPKGKGQPTYAVADAMEIFGPSFDPLPAGSLLPAEEVVLGGEYFGNKTPKIRFGGKKSKVLAFDNSSVTFRVPKKLPDGLYSIEISNKVGSENVPFGLEIEDSETPLFKTADDGMKAKLDGKKFDATDFFQTLALPIDGGSTMQGNPGTNLNPVVVLSVPFEAGVDEGPVAWVGDPAASISLTRQTGELFDPQITTWTTAGQGDDYEIVIMQVIEDVPLGTVQLQGLFSGELVRTEGTLGKATASITKGEFRVTFVLP